MAASITAGRGAGNRELDARRLIARGTEYCLIGTRAAEDVTDTGGPRARLAWSGAYYGAGNREREPRNTRCRIVCRDGDFGGLGERTRIIDTVTRAGGDQRRWYQPPQNAQG